MFEKGLYYDEKTKTYYNEHGIYLWNILIETKNKEPYYEKISKEEFETIGILPIELQGKDVFMFKEDYLLLKIKQEMGHELFLKKEKDSFYSIYSKNYFDTLSKQKTLTK